LSPIKIAFFTRYSRLGASSRLRTFQFQRLWENEGFEVNILHFFNDKYLKDFYSYRKLDLLNLLYCYFKRFYHLRCLITHDIIWIEKELIPFFPPLIERALNFFNKKLIVDYDDAFFHNYQNHRSPLIRYFLGKKIDVIMNSAHLVFAGNSYLEERAKLNHAKKIVLLPTVISSAKYHLIKSENPDAELLKIGWIGSPTTIKYLKSLIPVLEKINKSYPFELVVVNGERSVNFSGKLKHVKWKEDFEVEAILNMDIGIMPLPNNDWEKGKCAYKLIQYMACGLPVVASPVGMNKSIVQHGINGYLAGNENEWIEYLSYLINHPKERTRLGKNGHQMVHSKFTVDMNFKIMLNEVNLLLNS
jgi:glycosyltransferase involved in cell wall biosynthesis